ncbi:TetR/AcrR family transcriptional regulator [Variovorax sp. J2P1-59]|uniref:TetR/AcrR family transcriptional regulator n=1 Tax=Variovorax flavidus TaxID=3053501 RepID=UPI002575659E|nr:TetR/AcrR family transcriptional regulator [Variovorax sp. J2P1-59]MDM0078930.1 TetR/AcrR family transcriptional regulator [Variovorax sp. J2P1-59]
MTPYHHGDLKTALLLYAREQLETASLDALSMREMANAVGVSHSAAYRHFKDKRALLQAVATLGFEEMLVSSRGAENAAAADSRARLRTVGLAYVRFGLMYPRQLAHMFSAVSDPQASHELTSAGAELFELLYQLVCEGQREKAIRSDDARQLAHACWAMVHGLSTLLGIGALRVRQTDLDAQLLTAEHALDVFLDGMASRVKG